MSRKVTVALVLGALLLGAGGGAVSGCVAADLRADDNTNPTASPAITMTVAGLSDAAAVWCYDGQYLDELLNAALQLEPDAADEARRAGAAHFDEYCGGTCTSAENASYPIGEDGLIALEALLRRGEFRSSDDRAPVHAARSAWRMGLEETNRAAYERICAAAYELGDRGDLDWGE